MAQQIDPNFYGDHGTRSPREAAEAAMKECRDQQYGTSRVAEVDAHQALVQFQQFQVAACELRKTLIDQRNTVAQLVERLNAAIELLPDYDRPRAEPQIGPGFGKGLGRGNL